MKFKTILFMTLFLSTIAKAQDILSFDISSEVYMFVKEHKGSFTDVNGKELNPATKLSLCKITFYNEDDGALQLVISMEDELRKHLIRRYGLYLSPGTIFPLRSGTINYKTSEIRYDGGTSLSHAIFDGSKIEDYYGELVYKSGKTYSLKTIITDEQLNIQEYNFKLFERNQNGEMEEVQSYTCEATPLS